jgi:hypothetical protein
MESPEGKLLADVANAERTLQAGGQISADQQVQIKAAVEMLTRAHVAQGDVVIQGLGSLHGTIESITRQIANLAQKVEQHRIQSISSGWGS